MEQQLQDIALIESRLKTQRNISLENTEKMHVEFDIPDELIPVFIEFIGKINNKFIVNKIKADEPRNIPSKEEVFEYINTENILIDPNKFYNYYSEKDWTDKSGKPLTDWHAVARSWQNNQWTANKISIERNTPKEEPKEISLPNSIFMKR